MDNISFQARDLRGRQGKRCQAPSPSAHPLQPEDGSSAHQSVCQGTPWSLCALGPPLQNVLGNGVQGPHFGHVCHLYGVLRGREGRSHGNVRVSVRKTSD